MSQLSRNRLASYLTTAAFSACVLLQPCVAEPAGASSPHKLGSSAPACPSFAVVQNEQQVEHAVSQLSNDLKKLKRQAKAIAFAMPGPIGRFHATEQFAFDASVPAAELLAAAPPVTDAAPVEAPEPSAESAPPGPRNSASAPADPAVIPAIPAMEKMKQVLAETEQAQQQTATELEAVTAAPAAEAAEVPVAEAQASDPAAPTDAPAADQPAAVEPVNLEAAAPTAGLPSGSSATAKVLATAPKKIKDKEPQFKGDPMTQIVNIDFREMELSNVVALLAQKAQINVIAGSALSGVVTANLRNVTLQSAIDTVLRMNNLGMVCEEGVYHIVSYQEALAAKRITHMVRLENAKASDVKKTLQDVLIGSPDATLVSLSTNDTTNVLIIAGPEARVEELKGLAGDLDVSKPTTPTVTEAIKINNAEPLELLKMVESMLTPDVGKAAVDERSRHVVVTDIPVVIEQVRSLMQQVDMPVKQVSIDTMIVDAVLNDEAQTGVDWFLESVEHLNRRGQIIGSLQRLGLETDATGEQITPNETGNVPLVGRLAFGILSDDLDIRGVIGAEVRAQKARLLANPVITTVENKRATINITQEIPYQEFTQGLSGPPIATTSFKDIGIVLEVTPRVTHDDYVIADLSAKQSDTKGELNNIPIEDKRETITTLRTKNGQTIFIGGLRRIDDENQTARIPVLGDIPVINAVFKRNLITKESTELLVFLTCNVLEEEGIPLTPQLQDAVTEIDRTSKVPNSSGELGQRILHPKVPADDPAWKWRRPE